jgi:hypothetical protein
MFSSVLSREKLVLPLVALFLTLPGANARADIVLPFPPPPVVYSSGGSADGFALLNPLSTEQALGVSWSQGSEYTSVTISAQLEALGGTTQTGEAYLTTALGTGTTTNDEVASVAFSFPASQSYVTLFSGLDLPAGTYYLSLVDTSSSGGAGWIVSKSPTVQSGNGDSFYQEYLFATPPATYFPSTAVTVANDTPPNFSVTGTEVPEPSAGLCFALSGGLLLLFSRRLSRDKRGRIHRAMS